MGEMMQEAMRKLVEEVQRLELNGETIFLPESSGSVVSRVREYLRRMGGMPKTFGPYVEALEAVWPSLFKADRRAGLIMACEIFLSMAELEGFQVDEKSMIGDLYGDPSRIHGDARRDDGATAGCVA